MSYYLLYEVAVFGGVSRPEVSFGLSGLRISYLFFFLSSHEVHIYNGILYRVRPRRDPPSPLVLVLASRRLCSSFAGRNSRAEVGWTKHLAPHPRVLPPAPSCIPY